MRCDRTIGITNSFNQPQASSFKLTSGITGSTGSSPVTAEEICHIHPIIVIRIGTKVERT